MTTKLRRVLLATIAAAGGRPVSVPELEGEITPDHPGQVRSEVKKIGEAGLITFHQRGYVLTEQGQRYITSPRQETGNDH